MQVYDIDKLQWVPWKEIFWTWATTQCVSKFNHSTSQGNLVSVTCMAVSGTFLVCGHESGSRSIWSTDSKEQVSCQQAHTGQVTGLALVDLLHRPPYHSGLQHHAFVSSGQDGSIMLSVLLDQYADRYKPEQEKKVRQHRQPITSISTQGTMLAVLGAENRVSIWVLEAPASETIIPEIDCLMTVPGPSEQLITTRLWSNMLVFWMQKIVALDTDWQSRVFPLGGDPRARKQ